MTTAITPQQAFEKYFGTAKDLVKGGYPWKCKHCPFLLMSVDGDFEAHIRNFHDEKIMSQKQIDAVQRRAKEKEEKLLKERNTTILSIKGGSI